MPSFRTSARNQTVIATPSPEMRRWVRRRLLAWFKQNGRDFAWRHTTDPYQVLLAEMMVQRTRAAQAERVWTSFIERWPTAELARAAPEAAIRDVLRPLGLQWRIENIIAVVRMLEAGGDMRTLPGVDHYVANAVGCFAAGSRAAIVDANVTRIYSRLFGITANDRTRRTRDFHALAAAMMPRARWKEFNWALLDFGAAICAARPQCAQCTLRARCAWGSDTVLQGRSGVL